MNNDKQSHILKIANSVAGAFSPALAQKAVNYMMAQQSVYSRIEGLKKLAANDNGAKISKHLLEQLADIMGFMATKKSVSVEFMTVALANRFDVAKLSDLRDDQFQAALDCVLTWKTEYAM